MQYFLIWMVPFLFSLSFHEFAHAWVADRYGDPTARLMGRMTVNPVAHVDPIGTLLFPTLSFFTGFSFIGWAKPVPVNERNLRNPLRDGMIVAIAGPASNILLALVFTLFLYLSNRWTLEMAFMKPLQLMVLTGIKLNVFLAFFNLLPFPPLDGGRVIYGLFPALHEQLDWMSRYGFIILIIMMYTGLFSILLYPAQIFGNLLIQLTI